MVQTAKSSFMAKLVQAHEEHKGDETRVGSGGDLPGGIEQGVAQLVDLHIGTYAKGDNEGQPFFMGAGTVLEPEFVDQVDPKTKKTRRIYIQGLRTQIGPEPLCDTVAQNGNQTSLADHWDRVLNHLRLLGIDTKTIDPTAIIVEAEEGKFASGVVLEALVQAAPTFRFRTWMGKPTAQYPNPRVNHEWKGLCPYDKPGTDAVQDDTAEQPKWESDDKKAPTPTSPPPEPPKQAPPEAAEPEGAPDLKELAKLADAGKPKEQSGKAAALLVDYAKAAGIDNYEAMPSWEAVAEAVIAAQGKAVEAEAASTTAEPEVEEYSEEPEPWAPAKGEQAFFANAKLKKVMQCEIVEINAKLQKADIKVDGKLIKGVPFAKLSATESPEIPF
jgi:hypothetical protein